MKNNRRLPTLRHLCLFFFIGLGFLTIVATSGGSGFFEDLDLSFNNDNVVDFSFTPVTNAPLNTMVTSNEVVVTGFSSPKDIEAHGHIEYSIDGGPFTSQDGKIQPNSRLRVRILSAQTFDTVRSASVSVGKYVWVVFTGCEAFFSVTTMPGSAAEAPIAQILSPFDHQEVNTQSIQVTGRANDPDGIFSIEVNGIAATSVDGFTTWQARIPLETGPNVITIASADNFLNRNPTAAQIRIKNLGVVLVDPKAIETDVSNLRLLVADQELRALVAIDLIEGASSIISDFQTPDEHVPLTEPHRLAVNDTSTIAWIIDKDYDNLIRVNLDNGQRYLVEDTTVGGSPAEPIGDALDIAIDESGGRALLLFDRYGDSRVVALDLLSGEQTVLSDATTPDTENQFSRPRCLVMDSLNDRLLVFQDMSTSLLDRPSIISVDSLTGQRSVVIEATSVIGDPTDAELDPINRRVLIVNRSGRRILVLDLRNDELTTLWDWRSYYLTNAPIQIEIDPYNDRALLLHQSEHMLGAIDMATGDPSIAF